MKKFSLILLTLLAIFISTKVVHADYATDYQTYINTGGSYQNAYNTYLTARANYLASGSLESESVAKEATLKMLELRDTLIINYLTALSSKIAITEGILEDEKTTLKDQITTEIAWYNAHKVKLPSAASLNDLVTDSNEAKDRWNSTKLVAYQSLIGLGIGNNTYLRGKLTSEIGNLEAKIAQIRANQDKEVTLIERSLVDVKNELTRSQDKDNLARSLISSLKPGNIQSSVLINAQANLVDSNLYLRDANQGLLQIISQIKTN